VLGEEVEGAVGKGVAFVRPAIPANVGMDVVSVEADSSEDAQAFREDLVTDAVAGHGDYRVLRHESRFSFFGVCFTARKGEF
jgi:hypothetical protein